VRSDRPNAAVGLRRGNKDRRKVCLRRNDIYSLTGQQRLYTVARSSRTAAGRIEKS
jgi:hypothetical protein